MCPFRNPAACLLMAKHLWWHLGSRLTLQPSATLPTSLLTVLKTGEKYQRVDVVFDRYHDESIKTGTRKKRKQRHRPVHREIVNESVPLPADWSSFMALEENKADVARLLSNHLIEHSLEYEPVVVESGGFAEATTVKSSDPELEISSLSADHEEADTRLILHCIQAPMDTIVVSAPTVYGQRVTQTCFFFFWHIMIESDVPISTWKLGHQRIQSIFQYMTFASYYLMIKWTHSSPSMPSLAVIVCLSSADMERKQPGKCSSNIKTILLALGRALSQKILWIRQRNSSVRCMVCPRLIHATKQEWSCFAKVGHKRLCLQPQMRWSFISCVHTIKRQSGTKLTCHILIFLQWMKWDGCTRKVS